MDGKKIYKKTITRSSGVSTGNFTVAHGISNLAMVIKAEIFASSGDGATSLTPAMTNTSGGNYWAPWSINSTSIEFYSSVSTARPLYITLYYTKSN